MQISKAIQCKRILEICQQLFMEKYKETWKQIFEN